MIAKFAFGRTGHDSSRIIFGGYALSRAAQRDADEVLELLLHHGINHIDTAPMYGVSQKRIGSWMAKHRAGFFIATKTRARDRRRAWQDLQQSLEDLRVTSVDLWQMHGLTNDVGWEKAMGPGGALEALLEAREQGLVRFLGVTGHGNKSARMHLKSLERFDFDAVMLPYNYCQRHQRRYAPFFEPLAALCQARGTALQTFQSIARGPIEPGPRPHNLFFYEPLTDPMAIQTAVHWTMGLPGSFVITAGDLQLLSPMLAAAERFEKAPSDAEMRALVEAYHMKPPFPGA